jgi:tryptophanyl-tRNA synthetase
LAREIARRWNATFAADEPFFPEPQPILTKASRIIGLDGEAKMSKSLGNTIGVTESPEEIWQKLRPAKTDPARQTKSDPGTPEKCNLYSLHRQFSVPDVVDHVAAQCRSAGWGCIDCKRVLADNMASTLAPIRASALDLAAHPATVDEILSEGASRAGVIACETMTEVRERMGFLREG